MGPGSVKVYLAGPHTADDYRELAAKLLRNKPVELINPLRPERDFRGKEDERYDEIVNGDLDDINLCDAVLADWTKPSVGTSMECWAAWQDWSLPIFGFTGGARISPWYRFVAHENMVHYSLGGAVAEMLHYLRLPVIG